MLDTNKDNGNATINAGRNVSVASLDTLNVKLITGAVGVGLVGVGAGIGVLDVDTTNTARIAGASVVAAGDLAVAATTSHTLKGASVAGSVGLAAAVSGDVAIISDSSDTYAYVSGGVVKVVGGAAVNATSTRSGTADGYGVAFGGGGAVGISVASVTLGGAVSAYVEAVKAGSFAAPEHCF